MIVDSSLALVTMFKGIKSTSRDLAATDIIFKCCYPTGLTEISFFHVTTQLTVSM